MFDWSYNKNIFKDVNHNSVFDLCNIEPTKLGYGVVIFYNQPNDDTLFTILKRKVGFVLIKIEHGRSSGVILSGKTLANTLFKSSIYLKDMRQ